MSQSPLPRQCPQCGGSMPSDSPQGLCPRCLMKAAMESDAQTTDTIRSSAYDTTPSARRAGFTPPSVAELSPHFPQLQIIELLGQGGMGAVYKAKQRGLDRVIALKILPPDLSETPGFAERFTREARALARLNHPNIVSVFDFGRTDALREADKAAEAASPAKGLFYFIMEFIDGTNLRQAIRAKAMASAEALAIVPQVCDALQYAHEEGIVHRDIKPENILIDKRGKVKIADFGLAKLIEAAPDDITLTREGGTMGTPHYMAPEQLERAHEVDHRADIYSLGVVFYEMLTGELPLGRFAAPSKKVQIDVRLDEVVLRSLEKEPDLRWQHASEVKTQVDEIRGLPSSVVTGMQRAIGREYKSKATLFGLPLVHIAYGIDPKTGRKRVAKGIIAMGDVAIGVFAFGGMAMGGITFAGVGLGLVSFAGLAIGLLAAIGGLAIGTFAFGGLAIGGVAIGGWAFGIYAYGGTAAGGAVISSAVREPPAVRFFEPWIHDWPRWLTLVGIALPIFGMFIFVVSWFALRSGSSSSGWPGEETDNRPHGHDRHVRAVADDRAGFVCSVIALVMLTLGLIVPVICMAVDTKAAGRVAVVSFAAGMLLAVIFGLLGRRHRMGRFTALAALLLGVGITSTVWLFSAESTHEHRPGPASEQNSSLELGPQPTQHNDRPIIFNPQDPIDPAPTRPITDAERLAARDAIGLFLTASASDMYDDALKLVSLQFRQELRRIEGLSFDHAQDGLMRLLSGPPSQGMLRPRWKTWRFDDERDIGDALQIAGTLSGTRAVENPPATVPCAATFIVTLRRDAAGRGPWRVDGMLLELLPYVADKTKSKIK
ncbi:MAG: bifunctional serine/threonine protein kinase/MFS transporter [Phycisphaeraceae bacterium]